MRLLSYINEKIKQFIIKRASKHKLVDIVQVRTKEIGLLSVQTETDLRITNSIFLPYTILSIHTDLLNKDELKIGKMVYDKPIKIKGNSEVVLSTTSEISIITSFFQALSNLLSHPIWIRSVGIAMVKVLWFTIELPVDDVFEIQPSKIKILKEETEEERTLRLQKEAERQEQKRIKQAEKEAQKQLTEEEKKIKQAEKEKAAELKAIEKAQQKEERTAQRNERRSDRKEAILKRRHKENYIPKDEREKQKSTAIDVQQEEISNQQESEIISEEIKKDIQEETIQSASSTENINPELANDKDASAENITT